VPDVAVVVRGEHDDDLGGAGVTQPDVERHLLARGRRLRPVVRAPGARLRQAPTTQ
jgi:hypothetical protein